MSLHPVARPFLTFLLGTAIVLSISTTANEAWAEVAWMEKTLVAPEGAPVKADFVLQAFCEKRNDACDPTTIRLVHNGKAVNWPTGHFGDWDHLRVSPPGRRDEYVFSHWTLHGQDASQHRVRTFSMQEDELLLQSDISAPVLVDRDLSDGLGMRCTTKMHRDGHGWYPLCDSLRFEREGSTLSIPQPTPIRASADVLRGTKGKLLRIGMTSPSPLHPSAVFVLEWDGKALRLAQQGQSSWLTKWETTGGYEELVSDCKRPMMVGIGGWQAFGINEIQSKKMRWQGNEWLPKEGTTLIERQSTCQWRQGSDDPEFEFLESLEGGDGERHRLGVQCLTGADGECREESVRLVIDAVVVDSLPEKDGSPISFGSWESIGVRTDTDDDLGEDNHFLVGVHKVDGASMWMQIDLSSYSSFYTDHDFGDIEFFSEIEKKPLVTLHDEDGKTKRELWAKCTRDLSYSPPENCETLEIFVGSSTKTLEEYSDQDFSSVEAEVVPHEKDALVLLSSFDRVTEEYVGTLFVERNKKHSAVWTTNSAGAIAVQPDGSWATSESYCVEPDEDDECLNEEVDECEEEDVNMDNMDDEEEIDGEPWMVTATDTTVYRWTGSKVESEESTEVDNDTPCSDSEGRCPYVYAGREDRFLGEILEDQVGRKNWRTQWIPVPRSLIDEEGILRVRLAEEKPDEITLVDSVWLEVSGHRILPVACASHEDSGFCRVNGVTLPLDLGEEAVFLFENLPPRGQLRLHANGYYKNLRP